MKYVVSDIHGCYDKYRELLKVLALSGNDTLYILGDIIDRGSGGFRILLDMAEHSNVVGLMGNHEAMAIEALPCLLKAKEQGERELSIFDMGKIELWFDNGGRTSLTDYLRLNRNDAEKAMEYMRKLPLYKEVHSGGKDFVLVHGGLEGFFPSKPLASYKRDEIIWYRPEKNTEYFSDKYTVFGHTPTQLIDKRSENINTPKICYGNKWADIDCGCGYKNGRLGCLCLDSMEEIYV